MLILSITRKYDPRCSRICCLPYLCADLFPGHSHPLFRGSRDLLWLLFWLAFRKVQVPETEQQKTSKRAAEKRGHLEYQVFCHLRPCGQPYLLAVGKRSYSHLSGRRPLRLLVPAAEPPSCAADPRNVLLLGSSMDA